MIINEFSIIIVTSKRLRVWGEKEKGPTMMIAHKLLSWQLCHYIDQRYKDRDGLTASRTVIFMGDFTQKLFRL